ncbi:RHS repeat-associated core domain-containing protein, partial [Escherichia coli]
ISPEGETAWQGEYDEWGNLLGETSAQHLQQSLRLPGQQYDEESGLYYNRNRYYDPLQGRYITQDPIGLEGGWNLYQYPLNPIEHIDPLGLALDLNYYSPSDPIYKGSLNVREFPTGFTVGGHGSPTSMSDDRIKKGSDLTIKQLASDIRANPKYHEGMPVVLFSCETGKGKNSFAQKLANELDATVIAPDEIIWIWPDGNYAIMGQTARITIGGKDNGVFELVPDEKQPRDFHKFTPTGSK